MDHLQYFSNINRERIVQAAAAQAVKSYKVDQESSLLVGKWYKTLATFHTYAEDAVIFARLMNNLGSGWELHLPAGNDEDHPAIGVVGIQFTEEQMEEIAECISLGTPTPSL